MGGMSASTTSDKEESAKKVVADKAAIDTKAKQDIADIDAKTKKELAAIDVKEKALDTSIASAAKDVKPVVRNDALAKNHRTYKTKIASPTVYSSNLKLA